MSWKDGARYRYTADDAESQISRSYLYGDGQVRKPSLTYNYVSNSTVAEMWDIVTPDYKKLSGQGIIINNPMERRTIREWDAAGYFRNYLGPAIDPASPARRLPKTGFIDTGNMSAKTLGMVLPNPANAEVDEGHIIDSAITGAYQNMDLSKAALLETFAEMKKTVATVCNSLYTVVKILRQVRELKFRELRNQITPKEAASKWLEYRYGLRPIYFDIKKIIDASRNGEKPMRHTARGQSYGTGRWTGSVTSYPFDTFSLTYKQEVTVSTSARAGILCELTASDLMYAADVWGVDNILQTAWELVPFSFIVDWIVNVGDIIGSLAPKPGVSVLSSWVTVERQTLLTASTVHAAPVPNQYVDQDVRGRTTSVSACLGKEERFRYRIPVAKRPILPSIDINIDLTKIIDLVAIARQLYG